MYWKTVLFFHQLPDFYFASFLRSISAFLSLSRSLDLHACEEGRPESLNSGKNICKCTFLGSKSKIRPNEMSTCRRPKDKTSKAAQCVWVPLNRRWSHRYRFSCSCYRGTYGEDKHLRQEESIQYRDKEKRWCVVRRLRCEWDDIIEWDAGSLLSMQGGGG